MRKDKEANLANFLRRINKIIKLDPYEFEGFAWAARSHKDWAAMLSVEVRTVGRLMKDPQIVSDCTLVDGTKMVLVRIGEAGQPTERHIVNTMAKIFRMETGRRPSKRDIGCLYGLAQLLPDGSQVAIFKLAVSEWQAFMAGVKLEISVLNEQGEATKDRYYEFPSIPVIRRFHDVAADFYDIEMQAKKAG